MKPVLNAKDIKEYLGISLTTVYEMFRDPTFPNFKIGGRKLVKSEDFMNWLDNQKEAI